MRRLIAWMLLCAAATAAHAAAPGVVIYRCTDAFGAVTLQNRAVCPKGTRQQKQVIDSPVPTRAYRPVQAPVAIAPTTVPEPSASTPDEAPLPVIADKDRLPPPVLYQCNTFDHDSYLSESATPEPRCVRLQTTDLQGSSDDSTGVACQMVTDQCERVADGAACDSWKRRLRETQAAVQFARPEDTDADKLEFQRVQKIVRESTCGRSGAP
ncbi:MAG: putative secreted protein [Xanthomonadaceae bacterium]|nr:putative secreted protein [Xanthomonadaceae bacterium]